MLSANKTGPASPTRPGPHDVIGQRLVEEVKSHMAWRTTLRKLDELAREDAIQEALARVLEEGGGKTAAQLLEAPDFQELVRKAIEATRSKIRRAWRRCMKPLPDSVEARATPVADPPDDQDREIEALIESAGLSAQERRYIFFRVVHRLEGEGLAQALGVPTSRLPNVKNKAATKIRKVLYNEY